MTTDADDRVTRVRIGAIEFILAIPPDYQGTEEEFVAMRTARDAKLDMPKLILPSVQVNMRAGNLPPPEDNGVRYLKIPIDQL